MSIGSPALAQQSAARTSDAHVSGVGGGPAIAAVAAVADQPRVTAVAAVTTGAADGRGDTTGTAVAPVAEQARPDLGLVRRSRRLRRCPSRSLRARRSARCLLQRCCRCRSAVGQQCLSRGIDGTQQIDGAQQVVTGAGLSARV